MTDASRWSGVARGLAVAVLLAVIAGCQGAGGGVAEPGGSLSATAAVAAPGTHILTFAWGDRSREYVVDTPTGYNPARPIPLVAVLHGRPSDAFAVSAASGMEAFAEEKSVLVVYPQGGRGRSARSRRRTGRTTWASSALSSRTWSRCGTPIRTGSTRPGSPTAPA